MFRFLGKEEISHARTDSHEEPVADNRQPLAMESCHLSPLGGWQGMLLRLVIDTKLSVNM